jgi:hypothetical protein
MARGQFTNVQAGPTEFLDLPSLTLDEFQLLVPPFEAAFQAHLAAWCLDDKPRTAGSRCTRTVRSRRRKIDCSSSSPPSKPLRSR